MLLSVNNKFFLTAYFAIIKSGNICIPLDPNIEKENLEYISGLTNPVMIFMTRDIERKISVGCSKCIFPDTIGNDEFKLSLAEKDEEFDDSPVLK